MLRESEPMERKEIIQNVLQAAGEFQGRRLWKRFDNFDCFAIKTPGLDEPMLGIVMGSGGEEYGLSLFRGPRAADLVNTFLNPEAVGDDTLEDLDMLGFSMTAFGDLPPDAQAFLRKAGQHPRYNEHVPSFLVKSPGQRPRLPDEAELTLLWLILRGVVEADKRKLLQPGTLQDKEGISFLEISGDPAEPHVSATREKWQVKEAPRTIFPPVARPDLSGLPRLQETWLVGTPTAGMGIRGDDRAMQLLLIADQASTYIFDARPVYAGDLSEMVGALVKCFRKGPSGRKGLPQEIICSNRKLRDVLALLVEPLGVRCTFQSVIPKLREIAADLVDYLDRPAPVRTRGRKTPGPEELPVPTADDLKGWKEADRRLSRRFAEHFEQDDRLWSPRAVERYFEDDDLEHYLEEHAKQSVIVAYTAWGVLDYRPNKTSKTYAEKMLAEGLPEPEAILLRARMEAYPTLYRVAGHSPKAGTVDLEDVLLGGAVTVYDQLMSENIEDNIFFPARVFPAGQFHFVETLGPPLGPGMGLEAVEFLQSCRVEFTPEGLRRDAHKFGWMWGWLEEWEANWQPPDLHNTDGDEFVWHTASFAVADPAAVRQALLQRSDVQYDDEEDEFIWIKETGKGAKMLGGPVTMGRMESVGDELVLTVNSARRFATARKWLEKLPGVVFRDVKTRVWNEDEKDLPMDERLPKPEPPEMTPELIAHVQDMMDRHCKEWIDTPLPILGGQTPRQACRTEAGRRQVTMLIRTMPDPLGDATVRAPREAMLRELGLAAEFSASVPVPPFSEPGSDPAPARKVARNDPCPCGSGRKYKNCCGR